jgi:type VI secretion system protein ImpB
MAKEGSVAPRERVNIVYKPATGDAQEEKELPMKLLVMGDFTGRTDDRPLEDRKPINVDKDNFNEVMRNMNLSLEIQIANKLAEKEGGEMSAKLKFGSLKYMEPEALARQVPELKSLLDLREALTALKGPLGNMPEFRKKIQSLVTDPAAREKLLKEMGGGATEEKK